MMQAVGYELHSLILELQLLGSLSDFALAGGTSLALRYGHRKSEDIDSFSSKCIGKVGLQAVQEELSTYFGNNVLFCQIINEENGDQFCFLRALVNKNGVNIKIEILQNFALMTPIETIGNIKMLPIKDVGLLKLMSASNRQAKKDIYDLDIITDSISLGELLADLQLKREKFN